MTIRFMDMTDRTEERVYKSLWHGALFVIGIYEFRTHRTRLAKLLAAGMILFHLDAMVTDALNCKPVSRQILEKIVK
jgi:hypothetical protein